MTSFWKGINEFEITDVTARADWSSTTPVPKFNGEHSQRKIFSDFFKSMVENNEWLSPMERMRQQQVSNDNYIAAWELWWKRFVNKRATLWNYLWKFYCLLPAAATEYINKLIMDATPEFLANMEGIGVNVEHCHLLLIYSIFQKLDQESKWLWDTSSKASLDIPKLAMLL